MRGKYVNLLTTKNVKWLSNASNVQPDPKGLWQVIEVVDNLLLLSQDHTLIKIPLSDVTAATPPYEDQLKSILGRLTEDD